MTSYESHILQLYQAGLVPASSVLAEFGISYQEEQEAVAVGHLACSEDNTPPTSPPIVQFQPATVEMETVGDPVDFSKETISTTQ